MKNYLTFLTAALVVLGCWTSCSEDKEQDSTVAVTGVIVSRTTASIVAGTSTVVTAEVQPPNATNREVTWKSNSAVATVSGGTISGVEPGPATITVTTVDGRHTAEVAVTVTANEVHVTGVTVDLDPPKVVEIPVGASATVTATVAPSDATNPGVTWRSNAENVATVQEGVISGVEPGPATITVTTKDGGHTDSVAVTVTAAPVRVTSVTVDTTAVTIKAGETVTVTATVAPSYATNQGVTWRSNAENVATVSGGTITGVAEGAATITVTTEDGGHTAEVAVTVVPKVTRLWAKTAIEIGLSAQKENSIAVCGDYLVLSRTGICLNKADGSVASGKILNVTDIPTTGGTEPIPVGEIPVYYVANDSKGNMIGVTRADRSGVFNIYRWRTVESNPELLYTSSAGSGAKVSVVGDIDVRAFIYHNNSTVDGAHNQWEVVNGVLQAPNTFRTNVRSNDGNWAQTLGPLDVAASPSFFLVDCNITTGTPTGMGANVYYRDGTASLEEVPSEVPSAFRKHFKDELPSYYGPRAWGNYNTTGCAAFWLKGKAYCATLTQSWYVSLFSIIDATPDHNYYYVDVVDDTGGSAHSDMSGATAGACYEVVDGGNSVKIYTLFTGESVKCYEMTK
jgi:uncharacterized protein YjdB